MNIEGFPKAKDTELSSERHSEMGDGEKEELVRAAQSFSELYETLKAIGPVQGSREKFESEKIIFLIEKIRERKYEINFVTHSYGIRDTVVRLLEEQKSSDPDPDALGVVAALELPKNSEDKKE